MSRIFYQFQFVQIFRRNRPKHLFQGYLLSDNEFVLLWHSDEDKEDILLVSTDGTVTPLTVPLEDELGRVAGETVSETK